MDISITQWVLYFLPLPLLWLHFHWFFNIAYPTFLEKQIRKGKFWLYLPLNWVGLRRKIIRSCSFVFVLLPASAFLLLFWKSLGFDVVFAAGLALFCFLLIGFLGQQLILFRYRQQEAIYFSIFSAIAQQNKRDGGQAAEAEMRNLCSWEHQNTLRIADEAGRLLQELRSRAKAKKLLGSDV